MLFQRNMNKLSCSANSVLVHVLFLLMLVWCSLAIPMCTDSRAPRSSITPLAFCSNKAYQESGCCDKASDRKIQVTFQSMNVSDAACAKVLQEILCSKCDRFSGDLFQIQKKDQRSIPILCNSTEINYCSHVWDACVNVSMFNSPFAPALQGITPGPGGNKVHAKLVDLWQSKQDFCNAFGGTSSDGNSCFNGTQFTPSLRNEEPPPQGVCLEKVGNGVYLNMIPHPDGSNRVFVGTQQGQIYLATLADENSTRPMEVDESNPFIDLSDQLHSDSDFGLMGLAFHPDFVKNGRFFASFNCDKTKNSNCLGRCACNADANCDPSQLAGTGDVTPCQFHSVIAEYTVNSTATSPSKATTATATEVRRIFTMGLPFRNHHGGQLLFGPTDKYMYFMMGDGGYQGDPFNFAQNKNSLLGKILRLDVDNIPSTAKTTHYLWGNYSIPSDNPYTEDKDLLPEIWALGLRNPWRCSFDSQKPDYFYCADVGQDTYEEVDLIMKGGNYGWRVYEGNGIYSAPWSPGGNTSASSIQAIFPVMGYYHKTVDPTEGSASITGGFVLRSQRDPCLYGRYLYADLFGIIFAGTENPVGSGNFSSVKLAFHCSAKSPLPCTYAGGSKSPTLKWILSFGEDNSQNVYLLTATGVYRVGHPTDCNFVCRNDIISRSPPTGTSASHSPSPAPPKSSSLPHVVGGKHTWIPLFLMAFLAFTL